MASTQLQGMRVAILATDDFEQSELTEPKKALEEAGAQALIVAPHGGEIQGMNHDEKADRLPVDKSLAEADPPLFRSKHVRPLRGWPRPGQLSHPPNPAHAKTCALPGRLQDPPHLISVFGTAQAIRSDSSDSSFLSSTSFMSSLAA